jgi:hypothetical protein
VTSQKSSSEAASRLQNGYIILTDVLRKTVPRALSSVITRFPCSPETLCRKDATNVRRTSCTWVKMYSRVTGSLSSTFPDCYSQNFSNPSTAFKEIFGIWLSIFLNVALTRVNSNKRQTLWRASSSKVHHHLCRCRHRTPEFQDFHKERRRITNVRKGMMLVAWKRPVPYSPVLILNWDIGTLKVCKPGCQRDYQWKKHRRKLS